MFAALDAGEERHRPALSRALTHACFRDSGQRAHHLYVVLGGIAFTDLDHCPDTSSGNAPATKHEPIPATRHLAAGSKPSNAAGSSSTPTNNASSPQPASLRPEQRELLYLDCGLSRQWADGRRALLQRRTLPRLRGRT